MAVTRKPPPKDWKPKDHYAEVTDKIIALIEQEGRLPWRGGPWDKAIAAPTVPRNCAANRQYGGINRINLSVWMMALGTSDPRFATYKQCEDKEWQVKRGSKSQPVFLFKPFLQEDKQGNPVIDDETGEQKKLFMLKSFAVFHASQIEGIPEWVPPTPAEVPWRSIEAADIIMRNSGAVVKYGGDRAFYSPSNDFIQLPPVHAFKGPEELATTSLHELAHWTGHASRLDRGQASRFGSKSYAHEELVAELSSVFISQETGILWNPERHASYLDSWLKVLKEEPKALFQASAAAQKAADFCLAYHPAWKADHDARQRAEDAPVVIERPTLTADEIAIARAAVAMIAECPESFRALGGGEQADRTRHLVTALAAAEPSREATAALTAMAACDLGRQSPSRRPEPTAARAPGM